jgi:hypothetical protein
MAPLVVVVSRDSPLESLSLAFLRRIFLAEPLHAGALRIIPFNLPPHSPERSLFDARVLGMDPEAIARYWIAQRVRGQKGSPRAITTSPLLKQLVARLPGAIGYVHQHDVDDSVKPLSLDGRGCIDPEYALR